SWNRVAAPARKPVASEAGGRYQRPQLSTSYAAPRTETERRIAGIWESMLGIGQVGVHDSFLELGGDSLLAARLVARMRDAFELELPVRLFFEASNIEQLSHEVERRQVEAAREHEDDVAELVAVLAGLSEEEAEAELARRTAGGSA
ncbi:MAG: phosphopantetheine-binding protein, partial [bacterium]